MPQGSVTSGGGDLRVFGGPSTFGGDRAGGRTPSPPHSARHGGGLPSLVMRPRQIRPTPALQAEESPGTKTRKAISNPRIRI